MGITSTEYPPSAHWAGASLQQNQEDRVVSEEVQTPMRRFSRAWKQWVKHGEFLVELAGLLPRVHIADTEVTVHGSGLFTITVEVENTGFLPTSLRHGQRSRAVGPTLLQLHVDDDDILSGAAKTAPVGILAGSGSRTTVTWFIRGNEGDNITITLRSMKAGRDTATVTLR
jgi:hypothetical protein